MGRILLSAGHGGYENGSLDPGVQVAGTTEAREMILLRNEVVRSLQARGVPVLWVPDTLSLQETIAWVNGQGRADDFAIELHLDSSPNEALRGMTAYYIGDNADRRSQGEMLLTAIVRRVPQLPSRGAIADTQTGLGSREFCRSVRIPSLLLEVGFLTNASDRQILQNRRTDLAAGIADGLAAILRSQPLPEPVYESIRIRVNNQDYPERGILINGNANIPVNLAERLRLDLGSTEIPRVRHRNIVYVKAVDLRAYSVAVAWDNTTRTVILRTTLDLCVGLMGQIMGHGSTSDVQRMLFVKAVNGSALTQFPDLPQLYREEAEAEGVNYDVAFVQMCQETDFLRFGQGVTAAQNNFAGLGDLSGSAAGASFASARLGVRAHIQHLKAYASTEPLANGVVDPRFSFVVRGIAPRVENLSGRWDADANYGDKLMNRLRQLYVAAQLL